MNVPTDRYSEIVSREEAREILKKHNIHIGALFAAMSISFGLVFYTVVPKMVSMYNDFGIGQPKTMAITSQYFPFLIAIFMVLAFYFFVPSNSDEKLNKKISKLELNGEIKIENLSQNVWQPVVMILLGVMMGLLMTSVIMPIYNLTSSF
jgi:type II secretory pathway component PulF